MAKYHKCTKVFLEGGTSDTDHKFLEIAPTMRTITHEGRKYFKCPRSSAQDADGEWGMMYLWDGWGSWKLEQINAAKRGGKLDAAVAHAELPGDAT